MTKIKMLDDVFLIYYSWKSNPSLLCGNIFSSLHWWYCLIGFIPLHGAPNFAMVAFFRLACFRSTLSSESKKWSLGSINCILNGFRNTFSYCGFRWLYALLSGLVLYCTGTLWRELIPNVWNTIFVSITYIVVVKDNHCSQCIDTCC